MSKYTENTFIFIFCFDYVQIYAACFFFFFSFFYGLCKVDETPKGWYIQYIDRDPETIRRQLELEKKKKQDLDDEEKTAKFIEEQVKRGLEGKEQVSSNTIREAI
jgi:hypothetical protein